MKEVTVKKKPVGRTGSKRKSWQDKLCDKAGAEVGEAFSLLQRGS